MSVEETDLQCGDDFRGKAAGDTRHRKEKVCVMERRDVIMGGGGGGGYAMAAQYQKRAPPAP